MLRRVAISDCDSPLLLAKQVSAPACGPALTLSPRVLRVTLAQYLRAVVARRAHFPTPKVVACVPRSDAEACNWFRPSSRRDWRRPRSSANVLRPRRAAMRLPD